MQYLLTVIDGSDPATRGSGPADEEAAIDAFNERLQAEGHWVFGGGLGSPDPATVVDNRGDDAIISDGPFLESKEYLAGFWIIEAPDLDAALRRRPAPAPKFPRNCRYSDLCSPSRSPSPRAKPRTRWS